MVTVTDRAELPGGFCTQSLAAQAGGNGFDVVFRQFIRQSRCTISLFCVTERLPDSGITDQMEQLTRVRLMADRITVAPENFDKKDNDHLIFMILNKLQVTEISEFPPKTPDYAEPTKLSSGIPN